MDLNKFYIDYRNKSIVFFSSKNSRQKSLGGFILNLDKEDSNYDKIDQGDHFNTDYFDLIEKDGELVSVDKAQKTFFDFLFESKNLCKMILQCL